KTAHQRGGHYEAVAPATVSLRAGALDALNIERARRANPPTETSLVVFPTALRYDGRSSHLPWLREVPDPTSTVSWATWAELSLNSAKRLGVSDGDLLSLSTASGQIELPA